MVGRALTIATLLAATTFAAHAQPKPESLGGYPAKPVRLLVGNAPGGGIDLTARAVAQKLTERWGRSFVVDNRLGGTGLIAIDLTANATPDGYTLLVTSGSLISSATVQKKLPFDTRAAMAPISGMPHVRAGRLRALAVTSPARAKAFPEIPTVAESGLAGFELVNWYGMFAPAKAPAAVVAALHREVTAILQAPEVQAMFDKDGADAAGSASPTAFRKVFETEVGKWERYVKLPGFAEALK